MTLLVNSSFSFNNKKQKTEGKKRPQYVSANCSSHSLYNPSATEATSWQLVAIGTRSGKQLLLLHGQVWLHGKWQVDPWSKIKGFYKQLGYYRLWHKLTVDHVDNSFLEITAMLKKENGIPSQQPIWLSKAWCFEGTRKRGMCVCEEAVMVAVPDPGCPPGQSTWPDLRRAASHSHSAAPPETHRAAGWERGANMRQGHQSLNEWMNENLSQTWKQKQNKKI